MHERRRAQPAALVLSLMVALGLSDTRSSMIAMYYAGLMLSQTSNQACRLGQMYCSCLCPADLMQHPALQGSSKHFAQMHASY